MLTTCEISIRKINQELPLNQRSELIEMSLNVDAIRAVDDMASHRYTQNGVLSVHPWEHLKDDSINDDHLNRQRRSEPFSKPPLQPRTLVFHLEDNLRIRTDFA